RRPGLCGAAPALAVARAVVFVETPPAVLGTLSLHAALPISCGRIAASGRLSRSRPRGAWRTVCTRGGNHGASRVCRRRLRSLWRSEEHTSELQSRENLVCRPLLEKEEGRREESRAR